MVSTKTVEQTVTFNASPHDVYEALMDSYKHSQFTGAEAVISRDQTLGLESPILDRSPG